MMNSLQSLRKLVIGSELIIGRFSTVTPVRQLHRIITFFIHFIFVLHILHFYVCIVSIV